MRLVQSFAEIQQKIAGIRNQRKGFVSNFYPDEFRNNLWISKQQLMMEETEECVLLLFNEPSFSALYYVATTNAVLSVAISKFIADDDRCIVTDLVGMSEQVSPLMELFRDCGFEVRRSLTRMSCLGVGDEFRQNTEKVRLAVRSDVTELHRLLMDYFDPLSEQLPSEEELDRYIENSGIYVYPIDDKIAGFIIFELTKASFYLRHWFTHPDYRNRGVGSDLYKKVMYQSGNIRRQMLWVVDDNENAIKRYEHYGYRMEKLHDKVMMYNNQ